MDGYEVFSDQAEAGYESLDNYLYLEFAAKTCFVKPTNYDQKKSQKFKK